VRALGATGNTATGNPSGSPSAFYAIIYLLFKIILNIMEISTIKNRMKMIDELEEENKVSKELLKSALENDEEYVVAAKETKETLAKRRRIKEKILEEPENKKVNENIKANKEEIKTLHEILSAELVEYYQKNKTDQIEDSNGVQRKFKVVVKLLPKGTGSEE